MGLRSAHSGAGMPQGGKRVQNKIEEYLFRQKSTDGD